MTKIATFAGLDVSKLHFDVCIHQPGGPDTLQRFAYTEDGLQLATHWIPAHTRCVLEATGPYHVRLALHLYQAGFAVSVVNPLVIRRFAQMQLKRTKTDRSDARLIAAYAESQQPPAWQPPPPHLVQLQQWQALGQQLEKQHTALLNQREAFKCSGQMAEELQVFLEQSLREVEQRIEQVQDHLLQLVKSHHPEQLDHLTSIPGLGVKTALVLICITGGFSRFATYKQLCAYVGLAPRIYTSGSSVRGRSGICKLGMSRVRALLYMCAWSACRYNKACQALFERLVHKGKAKRVALIAVANKLLKQAFAIATQQSRYQENYSKTNCKLILN